ncbi:MAG: polyphosphate kinase 2 family protein [Nocardioides sp.]|nr:polyphosphate kinase 2 family protein [Nocardioides sp.]
MTTKDVEPGTDLAGSGTLADLPDLLRRAPGTADLDVYHPSQTPGFDGDKAAGAKALAALADPLADLQERLFAAGRSGDGRRVLVILQGTDTSGKGGTVRAVGGLLDPQGIVVRAFGRPTAEEQRHDFLWRIEQALPPAGRIGFFDRSHYEDVLAARVRGLVSGAEVDRRHAAIEEFEHRLVEGGTTLLKIMLRISPEEQRERLLARLDNPAKHWKLDDGDLDDRDRWADYDAAYAAVLRRCSGAAPWYVVPADRKWYRNLAVARLLQATLEGLDLEWPTASVDVEAMRQRLLAED